MVLNKEQLQAIKFGTGPLLIIAGAGTGKTTVITERIKYLITSGKAKPSEILALTFTQKAALEMEERVDKIVPFGFTQMWIDTFHAFGDRVLRNEALHLGLDPHYVLMTEAETILFLRKHLFSFKLNYFRPAGNPTKFLKGLIEHFARLKDEDISPNQYLDWAQRSRLRQGFGGQAKLKSYNEEIRKNLELARAYQKYEELKAKNGLMDFADLISHTLRLFRTRINVLTDYQKKFKYFLVDEFQDTNICQNELVVELAGKKANLTCVCDDDQAIYRWRGAAISNVLQFRKTYPQTKIITLTKNYRSSQEILNRAYELIQYNNPDRLEVKEKISKKLVAVRKINPLAGGEKIKFIFANRVENEADLVAKEIKKLTTVAPGAKDKNAPGAYKFKDFALLLRANNHAEPFVRAFLRLGIPFQFLGPGRLLRQEEVKDLIAYLRILYNFEDNVAFFRVLSLPLFAISARDIAVLRNFCKKYHLSLFEAAEKVIKLRVTEKSQAQILKIVKMIHKHLKLIPNQTAGQILYYFLEDTGILKKITEFKSPKEEQIALNIAKFFDKLKAFEAEHEEAGVEAVVDWLNLKMEMGESPLASDTDWTQENKVNLLTVHSSKGLEFPVVFLVNLVNDRFPTRERREQIPLPDELVKEILPQGDSHMQEERRLFYVGMTRAKDLLYFTSAKFYAQAQRIKKISPFVMEALGKQFNKSIIKTPDQQISIFDFRPDSSESKSHDSPIAQKHDLPINFLSYSQIETFNRCPLQYKFSYVLRIPVPTSAAAAFGTSIHQALKDFYQQILVGKNPKLNALWLILKKCWQNEGYTSKKHEQKMWQRAKQFLEAFYKQGFKKGEKPLALEQTFVCKISPRLRIGGRIDRINKLSDETLEIIDYKTGKVATQKEVDKNFQLTIYALAVASLDTYQQDPANILLSFYFLETQEKISTRRTLEDLEKAKKDLLNKAQEISQTDFLPKPGPWCDFCPYKLLCPAWV